MKKTHAAVIGLSFIVLLGIMGSAFCANRPTQTAQAQTLRLSPTEIRFESTNGLATISIFLGESALTADEIKSAAMEDKAWMFTVTKSKKDAATVTVATIPDKVEDGSYRLVIKARGLVAYANVFVNLTPTVSQSVRMVLPARLELDDNYVAGTTLTYKLETPIDLEYIWTINGKTVLQGPGETKLNYTFEEEGPCVISIDARQDGKVIGHTSGTTNVSPKPKSRL
jgi:hypothetical protein